ncbi:MAG: hypothetical protein ACTSQP_21090 [Promethearchaeota archaeon]
MATDIIMLFGLKLGTKSSLWLALSIAALATAVTFAITLFRPFNLKKAQDLWGTILIILASILLEIIITYLGEDVFIFYSTLLGAHVLTLIGVTILMAERTFGKKFIDKEMKGGSFKHIKLISKILLYLYPIFMSFLAYISYIWLIDEIPKK